MRAKNILGIFLVLLAVCFVGCNDNYTDVTLDETSVRMAYLQTVNVRVEGGSGQYTSSIDHPEIADVKIDQTYGAGTILIIEAKNGGEALITVTDKKSGKKAVCSLVVNKTGIEITDVRYGVEADQKDAILAELKEKEIYPIGTHFLPASLTFTTGSTGPWAVLDAEGKMIDQGKYWVTEQKGSVPAACMRLIPIDSQIVTWATIQVKLENIEHVYYMFLARAAPAIGNNAPSYVNAYFYEDLTATYKAEHPNAGINAVVRAYIYEW